MSAPQISRRALAPGSELARLKRRDLKLLERADRMDPTSCAINAMPTPGRGHGTQRRAVRGFVVDARLRRSAVRRLATPKTEYKPSRPTNQCDNWHRHLAQLFRICVRKD